MKLSKSTKITYLSKKRTFYEKKLKLIFSDLSTYHPESIYFRPLSGHLYLGHIDSLGRYRSETQSGPLAKLLISKEKKSFTITFKSWGQSQKDNEKGTDSNKFLGRPERPGRPDKFSIHKSGRRSMENCQDDNCRYNLIYHKIKMPLRNVQTNIPSYLSPGERPDGRRCPDVPALIDS